MNDMNHPLVSIVTVTWNAEKTIEATLQSVLSQTFTDYEYIIVDGQSSDSTYEIVCRYQEAFEDKGIRYIHISEKDNGIFDAMNKAISMASGEWINFMNADDKLHDTDVLEQLFVNTGDTYENISVIYGNTVRVSADSTELGLAKPIEVMRLNMPFCHQSSFTRTSVMKEYKFDLNYRVADYNFFLRLFLNGGEFRKTDVTIADYSVEGYSNQNKYKTYIGTLDVKHDVGLINKNTFKQKLKNVYFKQLLKDKGFLHSVVSFIDSKMSRRATED